MLRRRHHRASRLALVALILAFAPAAWSAQTVHLWLRSNGADILCDSTVTSLGGNIFRPLDPATGVPAREAVHRPIRITKRIDRCSPLLMQALANDENVDATIRFYRPDPSGTGAEQQYYTIAITSARIVGISMLSPDTTNPATATLPVSEVVSFTYGEITWTYEPTGGTFGPWAPR